MTRPGHSLARPWLLLVLAVAAFVPGRNAFGQPVQPSREAPPRGPKTLAFPGGTLKQYIEQMKQQTNEVVQVQLDDEIKNLQIEPAELAGVTAETALQLLGEHLARNRFRLTRSTYGGTPFWDISAPPRVTRVFSVRGFLNNRAGEAQAGAVEALISALEAALDLGSQSELEANFRIHPYTGLLLVSARQNQVDIIEQVVSQLDKAQTVSDDSVRDLKARIEALEREVRDLREELDRRPQTRNFPQEEHSRDAVPNLQLRTAEPRNRKPD